MFPRVLPLAAAAALYASATALQASPAVLDSLNLLEQSGMLPDDFRDHFFEAPLVVRVEVDGRYLGDARAILTRDNALSLLEFTEVSGSPAPALERERWLSALAEPQPLGNCTRGCSNGRVALHYSLESSLLSIATRAAAAATAPPRHHARPEQGSHGLILRHQLNAYGGDGYGGAGRYALDLQASVGHWTLQGYYQADRSVDPGYGLRQVLQSAFAQRELGDHFVRVGWFLPEFEGVARQPRAAGRMAFTTAGIMAGSSDSLLRDDGAPSLYPVQVTANREGSVEVYRDGSLIFTQALQPGLQLLETRRLPGGIYAVELRVIEDGREVSRETAIIHKPAHWRDTGRRWRYSAFGGVQRSVLDPADDPYRGEPALGAAVNYLAHPRAVVGMTAQKIGSDRAAAGSLDLQFSDRMHLYTNAYTSRDNGDGVDVQGIVRYRQGSVVVSHNRSWQTQRAPDDDRFRPPAARPPGRDGWLRNSALSLNHRIGQGSHLSARVSHQRGISHGRGLDLAFSRRQTLRGADATWRVSLFDRPGTFSTGLRRNRGVDITLNLALGREGRRYGGGLGTRTGWTGGRDLNARAGVQQSFEGGAVRGAAGQVTFDEAGLGLSGDLQFEHPAVRGDAYAQRSSRGGGASGGLNLDSTWAVGGGRLAVVGAGRATTADTGMIVDIRSDLPNVPLRAHDSRGGSYRLVPGRNLLPVSAFRAGALQIDFDGRAAPAAAIQPAVLPYHLNRGGVAYAAVHIVSTVTVMGHLRDAEGRPLGGAQVLNHAGRSVTEADGFFALEMSTHAPTLAVRHPQVDSCTFELDGHVTRPRGDTWMAGILRCPPSSVAHGRTAGRINGDAP
jgi:Mat/Ecp fimbriae outer membrane usher protein